jgi:plastocyanin
MWKTLAMMAIALVLAACGGDDEPVATPGRCIDAEAGVAELVAEDLAWFPDCLHALPDEPLTIRLENRDEGVQHNVHLTDAPGEPSTPLAPGPATQELDVTLAAGEYEYVCDIHPNMVGRLEVAAANPDP